MIDTAGYLNNNIKIMEINNIPSIETNELKSLVIKAAEEFYLEKDNGINVPDTVYDEMFDELKRREPKFNIFKELNLSGKKIRHMSSFPLATKTKIPGIENIIVSLSVDEIKRIYTANPDWIPGGKLTLLVSYQNGKLAYILATGFTARNILSSRVNVTNYPKGIFPNVLWHNHFRMIVAVDLNAEEGSRMSWTNPACVGIVPEVEFETADWSEVRKDIVQSEYFANLSLYNKEDEAKILVEYFPTEKQEAYAQEKWFRYVKLAQPDARFTPKMDGCSSVTYYVDGEKVITESRSDDYTGHDKTDYFRPFIPDHIDFPGKLMLMHELVINLDWGFGWNSRQKANGLTNSKYAQDQVALYATWVVYDAKDGDGNRVPLSKVKELLYNADKDVYLDGNEQTPLSPIVIAELPESPLTKGYISQILSSAISNDDCNIVVLPASFVIKMTSQGKVVNYNLDKNYERKFNQNKENYKVVSQGIIGPYRYCEVCNNRGEIFYLSNKLCMNHRVRVCDEFVIEDAFKFMNPELQAHYWHSDGGTFLADGIVLHERRVNKNNKQVEPFHNIFKYEYNEVVETKVIRIDWNESEFGTFIPNVVFDTVLVEGSYLSKASVGGWQALKRKRCGVGAKIQVVRINSTIPQILSVIEPVDAELPICPHCGRQLTEEKDLVNGVFKCSDLDCPGKLESKKWFLDATHEWNPETDLLDRLGRLVNIERYNKYRKDLPGEYITNILELIKQDKFDEFVTYVERNVFIWMTPGNKDGFNYGIKAAYDALRIKLGYK